MVLVGGGGVDDRHVQCGSDAVDKLDAGYIREGGSEEKMEWGGLDWSEVKVCRCRRGWLAAGVRSGVVVVVVGSAAVEVKLKVR
jgi:hypothetical protein